MPIEEYFIEAFVFANCNISRNKNITYLPAYMIMFLEKNNIELTLADIAF